MSKSYRTLPPRILASRKRESTKTSIIERKCVKNDYHPINRAMIKEFIKELPAEFIYGLKSIELSDRDSRTIGEPYAVYREDEKSIIIYSVPNQAWVFTSLPQNVRGMYFEHGAEETEKNSSIIITWKTSLDLAYFMFKEVFLHEIGHHYIFQYRCRNKQPRRELENELVAELHAERLSRNAIFYDIWDKYA